MIKGRPTTNDETVFSAFKTCRCARTDTAGFCVANMLRATLIAALLVVFAFAFIGCSSSQGGSSQSEGTTTSTMQVSDSASRTPVDYASNVEIIYQNDLGLYSGCEIVSLAMTLNSMGINLDSYDIADNYIEYANDFYASASYGNNGFGFFSDGSGEDFPPLDERKNAIDSAESDRPRRERPSDDSSEGSSHQNAAGSDENSNTSASTTSSSENNGNSKDGRNKRTSITDYYIGDPYYSGMAYPPAITKSANAILKDYDSALSATDRTGCSLDTLLYYVTEGYPVITWVTLDYTEPLVSWTPLDDSDWLWYDNLHCVVLCGYDSATDVVTVADPLQGIIEMPREEFETVFEECGNMAVTIS